MALFATRNNKSDIEKPAYIQVLNDYVSAHSNFMSVQGDISPKKPYGLSTYVLRYWDEYDLPLLNYTQHAVDDIRVFTPKGLRYAPHDYSFPKRGKGFNDYKVFIPYAWGNMSESNGLGGAYSNVFIAQPLDACTETYLECGSFGDVDTATFFTKYMMTRFARALLYVNKHSQHSTTAFGAIPKQDFTEDWWDLSIEEINEKLFDKYDVPQDIRDQVNVNIQTKDESNIITL